MNKRSKHNKRTGIYGERFVNPKNLALESVPSPRDLSAR
jgi:hypothetical protein